MTENIKGIINEAISELNEQLDDDKKLEFDDNIELLGRDAAIDSMDFVTLITIIEELILDRLGKNIHIVSDKAFSMEKSPFHSIGTLTDFVEELSK